MQSSQKSSPFIGEDGLFSKKERQEIIEYFEKNPSKSVTTIVPAMPLTINGEELKAITILNLTHPISQTKSVFAVLNSLGKGNAEVKIIQDIETNEKMAVKIFKGSYLKSAVEAEMKNLIDSNETKGYVTLKENDDTIFYCSMDLAKGTNLEKLISSNAPPHIEVFASEDKWNTVYQSYLDNKPGHSNVSKTISIFPLKKNPDQLGVAYFSKAGQKIETTIPKNAFIHIASHIAHLKQIDALFKKESMTVIQHIEFFENIEAYNHIMHLIGLPAFQCTRSLDQAKKIALSVVHATKHFQDRNILHRDIKPSQYMINTMDFSAKLIDYGSATKTRDPFQSATEGVSPQFSDPNIFKLALTNAEYVTQWIFYKQYEKNKINGLFSTVSCSSFEEFTKNHSHYMANVPGYRAEFQRKKPEISKKLDRFYFDKSFDIYSLGITLDIVFGVAERINACVQYQLKKPVFAERYEAPHPSQEIYRIKDIQSAKKNCSFLFPNLNDREFTLLFTFLHKMTDEDRTKRPNIYEVEDFFTKFLLGKEIHLDRLSKRSDAIISKGAKFDIQNEIKNNVLALNAKDGSKRGKKKAEILECLAETKELLSDLFYENLYIMLNIAEKNPPKETKLILDEVFRFDPQKSNLKEKEITLLVLFKKFLGNSKSEKSISSRHSSCENEILSVKDFCSKMTEMIAKEKDVSKNTTKLICQFIFKKFKNQNKPLNIVTFLDQLTAYGFLNEKTNFTMLSVKLIEFFGDANCQNPEPLTVLDDILEGLPWYKKTIMEGYLKEFQERLLDSAEPEKSTEKQDDFESVLLGLMQYTDNKAPTSTSAPQPAMSSTSSTSNTSVNTPFNLYQLPQSHSDNEKGEKKENKIIRN